MSNAICGNDYPSPFMGRDKEERASLVSLYPSPFMGRVARERRVGLSPHTSLQPPTRHIVRFARDVPPSPQVGGIRKSEVVSTPQVGGIRKSELHLSPPVMAGLVPAIHVLSCTTTSHPHPTHRSRRSRCATLPTRGRDKKQPCLSTLVMVRRTTLTFFIPPLYGKGGAKRRVGLSPHTPRPPPPVTSFASLAMCHPPHDGEG